MVGAFLYLFACSFRNRIRVRLRRLRQPRYLIGLIVGLVYLYFAFFQQQMRPRRRGGAPVGGAGLLADFSRFAEPLQMCGGAVLFLMTAVTWLTPGASRPIEFTRAEVQFLFQAPIARRQLIHYKLLRGQLGAIIGSAVMTVVLRPSSFASGWTFLLGTWLMFAVVRLHFIGIALRRQSLAQHGLSGIVRNWLPVSVVVAAVAVLVVTVAMDWSRLAQMETGNMVFRELFALASQGPAHWVLWPFVAIVKLPLAMTPAAFLQALPPVLILLVLNYLWVLRGDRAFEEASADDAERRAHEGATPRAVRRPSRPTPFVLGLTGRPEMAILWKNLILLGRYATSRSLLRALPLVIVAGIAFGSSRGNAGLRSFAMSISLIGAAMTMLIGPQTMRNDFRQDLANMAVLKAWPIRGAALVRGELLAPTLVLTVVTWLLLMLGAVLFPPSAFQRVMSVSPVGLVSPLLLAAAVALLAPGLIAAQLLLQNGLAVLFPAWIVTGPSRPRGIDAMGQRLLMSAGIALVLIVSLLPALIVGGVVGAGLYVVAPSLRVFQLLVPAALGGAVMIAECLLAAEWLGRVFDRTDVSAVEASE